LGDPRKFRGNASAIYALSGGKATVSDREGRF
jgi:hypothetical protein